MSSTAKRTRATASPGTSVGIQRYALYKAAYSRIKLATEQGFYLEAITLIESLISDRLESRLTFLKKTDFSFKTLGTLIDQMKAQESNSDIQVLIADRLNKWRNSRNISIHEMVKLSNSDASTWLDRTNTLSFVAEEGFEILRELDKILKCLRKDFNN